VLNSENEICRTCITHKEYNECIKETTSQKIVFFIVRTVTSNPIINVYILIRNPQGTPLARPRRRWGHESNMYLGEPECYNVKLY
jgi:hypothetical protein